MLATVLPNRGSPVSITLSVTALGPVKIPVPPALRSDINATSPESLSEKLLVAKEMLNGLVVPLSTKSVIVPPEAVYIPFNPNETAVNATVPASLILGPALPDPKEKNPLPVWTMVVVVVPSPVKIPKVKGPGNVPKRSQYATVPASLISGLPKKLVGLVIMVLVVVPSPVKIPDPPAARPASRRVDSPCLLARVEH